MALTALAALLVCIERGLEINGKARAKSQSHQRSARKKTSDCPVADPNQLETL